ncbi:uncharacterized protein [Hyperolius riggenbachi]|uniref:uncharacterized protein n=1 Tax=Hyperolius riggenbachi TaxID=752182 RepID=UPI0035A35B21
MSRHNQAAHLPAKKRAAVAVLLLGQVATQLDASAPPKKRRIWCKSWLEQRHKFSDVNLLNELRISSPEDFKNYLRMSDSVFQHLLSLVGPHISKQESWLRKPISAEQRLVATLRYLATGRSLQDLKFSTGISPQALGLIIPETCEAIINCLKNEYMKFPKTSEEWLTLASDFERIWHFPNCGGAIDGKHIRITPPPNSGSYYFNYKHFFSIVLMAIVNANYEFIYIDVGRNGRMSDGGVIEKTEFNTRLKNRQLSLPTMAQTKKGLNFVFVADDAFGLHPHILKPFPHTNLSTQHQIYNYRLSRARRVVENAFGILANRFRIFHTAINLRMDKIDLLVYASCILHNFLRRQQSSTYMPPHSVDREDLENFSLLPGEWRSQPLALTNLQPLPPRNPTYGSKENRDAYVSYFNGEGAVTWQNNMIG